MNYIDSLNFLNGIKKDELSVLENYVKLNNFTECERYFSSLFSVYKEIDFDELYIAVKSHADSEMYLSEDSFPLVKYGDNGEYIKVYADPINCFSDSNVNIGDSADLFTFRKINKNPKALLLDGLSKEADVFDVIKNDGLNDIGIKNYLYICDAIRKVLANDEMASDIISLLLKSFSDEEKSFYCYNRDEILSIFVSYEVLSRYYECSSIINCVLEEKSDERVKIKPLKHSLSKTEYDSKYEFEDFGEVGSFYFDISDYK